MYSLTLTQEDVDTIAFVGYRYCWSDALAALAVGVNKIPEHEAWKIRDAFDRDTEGGHSFFPMLAPDCELYAKLIRFWEEVM